MIYRPTIAEINLQALKSNALKVRSMLSFKTQFIFVVKANAYGHGAAGLAEYIQHNNLCDVLGVASVEEGIELRNKGVTLPILVLGSIYPFEAFDAAIKHDLSVTVASTEAAKALIKSAGGQTAACHIKQDTGMGRIGTRRNATLKILETLHHAPNIKVEGVYTHLSSSDTDAKFTEDQLQFFADTFHEAEEKNIPPYPKHIVASYALEKWKDFHFDGVRCGLAVYGMMDGFEPVLSLKSKIVYIKDIQAGFSVSYGRSFKSAAPMRVATLPIGYGDGYLRALSNKADVLIEGKRCKVLGNVTMDMLMVDITHVPAATVGTEAVLIGAQNGDRITAAELAEKAGTISYEITTLITARVPRVYKK